MMKNREELYNNYRSKFSELEIDENNFIKKYTSVEEEYNLVMRGVAVRDLSNYSKIFIHGKDSESLLKRLTTNKIIDLKVLEWVKTLFVNNDGNIIDRSLLLKFEDYFLLLGSNIEEKKLFKWILRFVMKEDMIIENSAEDYSLFEVMGLQANSYMSLILGDKFNELSEKNILRVQVDDFFVHGVKVKDVGDIDKYVILVDSKNATRILDVLDEAKSVFDFGMVGEDAYNIFRIENGIPIAPNELNDTVNPMEVNLQNEVCCEKHSYIGHEVLEEGNGGIGKLVGITFKDNFQSSSHTIPIQNNLGDEIGIITSFVKSDHLKQPLGLGFIESSISPNGELYFAVDENIKTKIEINDL